VIGAVANKLDGAIARAAVERVVPAIARAANSNELQAYAAVIGAVADKLDGATKRAAANTLVERAVPAIVGATNPNQLQAYAAVIGTVADKLDNATGHAAAHSLVEQLVPAIAGATNPNQLQAYAAAILSMQGPLRREVLLFAATEILKHPLAARGDTDGILAEAICNAAGWPEHSGLSLWDLVLGLMKREPWLPLSRPPQPAEIVLAEFRHLLEHGPPLPHLQGTSA
jgi:hypothetical protein